MEKNTIKEVPAQGAGTPSQDVDLSTVRQWLQEDVRRAVAVLNAVQSDPNVLDRIAEVFYGRILNMRNEEALRNQTKMDL